MTKEMQHRFQAFTIRETSSVRDAIEAINLGGIQLAVVADGGQHVIGLVTDGDIRRAILAGASLQDSVEPHFKRSFISVDATAGRAEVLELMRCRDIRHVPVLDSERRLLGVHLLHALISRQTRENSVVILAGGKGTRLYPLTESVPKPMLKVAGRPILERLLLHLVGFGFQKFFLSVNYLSEQIEGHFGNGHQFGCQIEYLREKSPLGTGGPLKLLIGAVKESVLVLNGDLVTQANVGHLLDYHCDSENAATVGVRNYFHQVPYGCVQTSDGRITALEEKPLISRLVNTGIYVFEPWVLDRVPGDVEFPITQLVDGLVTSGEKVGAYEIHDDWQDIGQRDELMKARGEFHA